MDCSPAVKKLKETDPKRRPPTPFPMEILGDRVMEDSLMTVPGVPIPPPIPPRIPPPIPPKPIKTSTPLGESPPKFINNSGKPLEYLTRPMNKLLIPRDLLHTFSPTSVQTIPMIHGCYWWEDAQTNRPAMSFIPRTCVGGICIPCMTPKYYATEDCTCLDPDPAELDVKFLLSREHRMIDQFWTDQPIFIFEGHQGYLHTLKPPKSEDDLEREERLMNFEILQETKWLLELFTLLEDNELTHFWFKDNPSIKMNLTSVLDKAVANVEFCKQAQMDRWRLSTPNIEFMSRMRDPRIADAIVYAGSLNPFTGFTMQEGETWSSCLETAWTECCTKRAKTMVHIQLLDETLDFLKDTISQEEIASCLNDLQSIVETKMKQDCPVLEEEELFFQTALATLVLQWELNFRKESLRLDISHLITRLEKIEDRVKDIDFNGCLEDIVKDDTIYCCNALNTASGCRATQAISASLEKPIQLGILEFTTQQIAILQNGLRRTLILEEIFQRLSTQILHKITSFPNLRNARLIPLDFNMEEFMTNCLLPGESITRCRFILGRWAGRNFPGCSGCTPGCSMKDFARL